MRNVIAVLVFYWRSWSLDAFFVLVAGGLILAPGSGFKSVVIWVAFLFVLVRSVRTGMPLRMGGIGFFVWLYLAACAASVFFSIDMLFSLRQLVKLVELVAGFIVLVTVLSPPGRLARGLRQMGLAMGLIATADFLRLGFSAWHGTLTLDNGRWFDSLLGFPTIAAGMLAVGLVVMLINAVRPGAGWQRVVWLVFALQIVVLLYWLQTRSVLLGLFCAMMIFLLLGPLVRRLQVSIVIAGVVVLVLFALIPGAFRERILSGSFTERRALWADAGKLFEMGTQEAPYRRWVGFGYGHRIFEKLHQNLAPKERQASRVFDHAHNMLVESRMQTGWLGLGSLVSLLLALVWSGVRRCPSRAAHEYRLYFAGLAAALGVLLVYAQFSLVFSYLPVLMLWGLMAAYVASLQPAASASGENR